MATNIGVGKFIREQLAEGFTPKDILANVQETFPEAKTTMACIYWYRNDEKIKQQVANGEREAKPKRKAKSKTEAEVAAE